MSLNFDLWLKGCEVNNTILYCLEGSGDTGLYKLQKQYEYKNNYFYENPVYIGWVKGKQVCACGNYLEALNVWLKAK